MSDTMPCPHCGRYIVHVGGSQVGLGYIAPSSYLSGRKKEWFCTRCRRMFITDNGSVTMDTPY